MTLNLHLDVYNDSSSATFSSSSTKDNNNVDQPMRKPNLTSPVVTIFNQTSSFSDNHLMTRIENNKNNTDATSLTKNNNDEVVNIVQLRGRTTPEGQEEQQKEVRAHHDTVTNATSSVTRKRNKNSDHSISTSDANNKSNANQYLYCVQKCRDMFMNDGMNPSMTSLSSAASGQQDQQPIVLKKEKEEEWIKCECNLLFCENHSDNNDNNHENNRNEDEDINKKKCKWSHFAIDTILNHNNGIDKQCQNETHLQEFFPPKAWSKYQFSDGFSHPPKNTPKNQMRWANYTCCKQIPNTRTLLDDYYEATKVGYWPKVGSRYDVLSNLIQSRIEENTTTTTEDPTLPTTKTNTKTLVLHIRIGDVIDDADDSVHQLLYEQRLFVRNQTMLHRLVKEAGLEMVNGTKAPQGAFQNKTICRKGGPFCFRKKWMGYVKPLEYYSDLIPSILSNVDGNTYTKIVIMGGAHKSLKTSKSCQYTHAIQLFLQRSLFPPQQGSSSSGGGEVSLRLGQTPDDDIIFAASQADTFIPSGGGFSRTLMNLQATYQNMISTTTQIATTK